MLGLHLTGPVLLETILLDAELSMSFQSICSTVELRMICSSTLHAIQVRETGLIIV